MMVRISRNTGWMVSAAVLALAVPSFAIGASGAALTVLAQAAEPASVTTRLINAIRSEVSAQPATASAADLEGFIVFAISQGDYQPAVIDAALTAIEQTPGASDALKQAVANVRNAMLKRKPRGTSAIAGRGGNAAGGGGGGSGFTAPIGGGGGGGGGSSNYSS